jgi:molybdopterin-guanine dinucleotide biosynthesis protein A
LADGLHPPVHSFLEDAGAVPVAFPETWPFVNVNTPLDLAFAEQKLGKR